MNVLTGAFVGLGASLILTRGVASEPAVHLSSSDMTHLGLRTAPAASATYVEENQGFAVVVGRELVAQTMDDLIAAQATARQSHAALDRMRRLAGTAGADSATVREGAERQTAVDDAALDLAQVKASAAWGRPLPASTARSYERLRAIAAGRLLLVRITFPLGSFLSGTPGHVELQRLDAGVQASVGNVTLIWPAPSDDTMPGRSYFATLDNSVRLDDSAKLHVSALDHSPVQAGEHLAARAASGARQSGALIPGAALIISGTGYWCYVEREPGTFERTLADINHPIAGGYFMSSGIEPGDAIVVAGAGLLLARESNSGTGTDPDPDPDR